MIRSSARSRGHKGNPFGQPVRQQRAIGIDLSQVTIDEVPCIGGRIAPDRSAFSAWAAVEFAGQRMDQGLELIDASLQLGILRVPPFQFVAEFLI